MMESDLLPPLPPTVCGVCSVPSTKYCSNCYKVYYCSTEHQKSHRKSHKDVCYPVDLHTDNVQGRHFVTTKSLTPGDLIFVDDAIVHGPSGAEPTLRRICIGCCKILPPPQNSSATSSSTCMSMCSRCNWPVCGLECASRKCHSEFECPIFSQHGIKYEQVIKTPIHYDLIKYLRTALLKTLVPASWQQLAALCSHPVERASNPVDVRVTCEAYNFICKICHLENVEQSQSQQSIDFADVNHIVGIWTVNSFGANPPMLSSLTTTRIAASFLFPKTSLASHGCIANTNGILIEKDGGKFAMKLYVATSIGSGEPIFITYVNIAEGTAERQHVLKNSYYFTCSCSRCLDPTECGTNYSSVHCIIGNCSGHLLPVNPTNADSLWKCSSNASKNCSGQATYSDDGIRGLIHIIRKDLNRILNERDVTSKLDTIWKLENLLALNANAVLHPNHWLVVETEYNLIQLLTTYILSLPGTGTGEEMRWTTRLIEICKHCLSIADVLQPGLNSYRGNVLYCLVEGQLNEVVLQINNSSSSSSSNTSSNAGGNDGTRQISRSKTKNGGQQVGGNPPKADLNIAVQSHTLKDVVLPKAQEAYKIFSMGPETNENGLLARKLTNRINQIRAMIDNFNRICK